MTTNSKIKTRKKVPNLRFIGFGDEWQEKRLKELAKIGTGKRDTQDRVRDGKYPFYVRSDTVERINSFGHDGEAILTSGDGVGVGRNFHYVTGKFDFHQRVYAIKDFEDTANAVNETVIPDIENRNIITFGTGATVLEEEEINTRAIEEILNIQNIEEEF